MIAVCNACGKEWPRHPALASARGEVECPKCHAAVGVGCTRPSGHAGPLIDIHTEREQRAVDEGMLELCPASAALPGSRGEKDARNPAGAGQEGHSKEQQQPALL